MTAQRADALSWHPQRPRLRPLRLLLAWVISAIALLIAAGIVPDAHVNGFWGALLVAAIVAVLNAILPPLVAALRLPFTVAAGFLLVLVLDAVMLRIAADIVPEALQIDQFGDALLVALVASAGFSFILLRGLRDQVANQMAGAAERRKAEKDRLRAALAGDEEPKRES